MSCVCCGSVLAASGSCLICDATMSSPPHVCLRWLEITTDEHGCPPEFGVIQLDHETAWRLGGVDGTS